MKLGKHCRCFRDEVEKAAENMVSEIVQDVGTGPMSFSPLTGVFCPWSCCVGLRALGPLHISSCSPSTDAEQGNCIVLPASKYST